MKLIEPLYDDLIKYLGRHVEVADVWEKSNPTVKGRLACVAMMSNCYIGVETKCTRTYGVGSVGSQLHLFSKWQVSGPTNILTQWTSSFEFVTILGAT